MRRTSRRRMCAAVLATALSLVIAPLSTTAATAEVARPGGPLTPPSGSWFGAVVNPNSATPEGTVEEVGELESRIGRKLDINQRFFAYGEGIDTTDVVRDLNEGRIPLITWGASDTIQLANGSQDTFVRAQARKLRDLGKPVFLRFYHEMDGDYRTSIVHSPADFIAAWRHVYGLFQEVGATNVAFVWCPTAWKFRQASADPKPQEFYPGDAYVDWIAADGYSWYPADPNAQWRSFEFIFQKFYDWAITKDKPIMAAEYGVQEDPAVPGRKGQWFREAQETLTTTMTEFQAVVYFDVRINKNGKTYDWRLNTSTSSMDAWADMAQDPYFNPGGTATNQPPTASFTASCTGLTCAFDATASSDPDGSISSRQWEFGDGTFGSGRTPTKTYASAGTYSVRLTVTDNEGATATASRQVTVSDPAGGTVAFRAAATAHVNSKKAHKVTVPADVRAGDALVLFFTMSSSAHTISGPTGVTGWTTEGNVTSPRIVTQAWSKVATAADAGKVLTVTTSGLTNSGLTLLAYSGTSTTDPTGQVAGVKETVSRTTHTTPTVNVAQAGSWVLSYWADKTAATTSWSVPADQVKRADGAATGSGHVSAAAADPGGPVATGSYGGIGGTADSATQEATSWSVVLQP